jgi:hypothetical protein
MKKTRKVVELKLKLDARSIRPLELRDLDRVVGGRNTADNCINTSNGCSLYGCE